MKTGTNHTLVHIPGSQEHTQWTFFSQLHRRLIQIPPADRQKSRYFFFSSKHPLSFIPSLLYLYRHLSHNLITGTCQAGTPGFPPCNPLYTQDTSTIHTGHFRHQLITFRGLRTRSNSYWVFLIWLQFYLIFHSVTAYNLILAFLS